MPSTIGKCKLFRIKHATLLEGKTFLRNKHEIAFFEKKCTFFGRKENTITLQNNEKIKSPNLITLPDAILYISCGSSINKQKSFLYRVLSALLIYKNMIYKGMQCPPPLESANYLE